MFKAIFKDAADVELHVVEDLSFTFSAVSKAHALEDALMELYESDLPVVQENWNSVDLKHGYGSDTILRDSPEVRQYFLSPE